jgi:hypothetical protein
MGKRGFFERMLGTIHNDITRFEALLRFRAFVKSCHSVLVYFPAEMQLFAANFC